MVFAPRMKRRRRPSYQELAVHRQKRVLADTPRPPGFSLEHLDQSVSPSDDFYRYAVGSWIRANPVPSDKSRWGAFEELVEYNYHRIHGLLDRAAAHDPRSQNPVEREVGDFYRSAMDTARRNRLRFSPLSPDLARVDAIESLEDLVRLLAGFHAKGISTVFTTTVYPDKKHSELYALYVVQGGLSLPDRDYYLSHKFVALRVAFERHMRRVFKLLGDSRAEARHHSRVVLKLETQLARISRSRTALRDEEKNYHKVSRTQLGIRFPSLRWDDYFDARGIAGIRGVVVGQPEFLLGVSRLLRQRPLSDWKAYLRWHVLRSSAPYLHHKLESEYFQFFHRTLLGQRQPEPTWKRAARVTDRVIGDALGQLFVAEYFPRSAAVRMKQLVRNLRAVFRERLRHLEWMTPATRRRALRKFDRFSTKIGHPRRFRDDTALRIDPQDYLGNVRRAMEFESRRKLSQLGHRVDPDEWRMTPPTVNAYFDATQNEIVFPAGILQPPFFDPKMDDAVNYGGIGLVIGHEITHGYDDQGRRYDDRGNLREWWTPRDAREFRRRAERVVKEYDAFEVLPGMHVKGALTVGENIADIGGVSISFEALQRQLKRSPARRTTRDGLTPEQRFFISYAQIWRETVRRPEARRLVTVDEHAPGRFRVIGAVVNSSAFFEAFGIQEGTPMYRPESERVQIW
jgi:putative endopeptidase